jgi:hypothetical protein
VTAGPYAGAHTAYPGAVETRRSGAASGAHMQAHGTPRVSVAQPRGCTRKGPTGRRVRVQRRQKRQGEQGWQLTALLRARKDGSHSDAGTVLMVDTVKRPILVGDGERGRGRGHGERAVGWAWLQSTPSVQRWLEHSNPTTPPPLPLPPTPAPTPTHFTKSDWVREDSILNALVGPDPVREWNAAPAPVVVAGTEGAAPPPPVAVDVVVIRVTSRGFAGPLGPAACPEAEVDAGTAPAVTLGAVPVGGDREDRGGWGGWWCWPDGAPDPVAGATAGTPGCWGGTGGVAAAALGATLAGPSPPGEV